MSQVGPFTEPTNPVDDQGCQPERALRRSEPEGFSSLGRATESKIQENNHFKRSAPLRLKLVISRVFDDGSAGLGLHWTPPTQQRIKIRCRAVGSVRLGSTEGRSESNGHDELCQRIYNPPLQPPERRSRSAAERGLYPLQSRRVQ